jgi:hypothetical protein
MPISSDLAKSRAGWIVTNGDDPGDFLAMRLIGEHTSLNMSAVSLHGPEHRV